MRQKYSENMTIFSKFKKAPKIIICSILGFGLTVGAYDVYAHFGLCYALVEQRQTAKAIALYP